ncbi:MAG: hypothetical protein JWM39_127 [Parcubacteria group bacterium]|jgi:hypothetical protein|nr:hypothetical protein [Parcubacteria group bacterium]
MRTFALGIRSLLTGTLLFAALFVVAPTLVHAQAATPPAATPPASTGIGNVTATLPDASGLSNLSASDVPTNADGSVNFTGSNAAIDASAAAAQTEFGGAPTATTPAAAAPAPAAGGGATTGCGISNIGDCILNVVATFIITFTNFILAIAGTLLNWVIVKTVFQFSTLIGNSAGLLTAWGILRDIGNLILLFGFVLMGISIILDTGKFADKKAIPKLIIFAILLNFSIFAAEAIIDTSNVLTSALYAQANTDPCVTTSCNINSGIAGHIMESTGLSGIYALKTGGTVTVTNKALVLIGLSLFSIVGTVVLLAAALMLAWRAVVLTGLIVLSPIGFAGMALPPLEKIAKGWWNTLIHQAFFAPILFLLIFIDLKVTEGFSSVSNNNGLASALTGPGTDNMGIIMVFLLIIAGLIGALMAAKKFGAMGADFAIKTAGGVAFGSGAFVARRTVGAGSAAIGRSIRNTPGLADTEMGRRLASIADRGAKSSFDPRATKFAGNITKAAKIDLGKPGKTAAGGYAEIEKKDIKARTDYANSIKPNPTEDAEAKALKEQKKNTDTAHKTAQTDSKNKRDSLVNARNSYANSISDLEKKVASGEEDPEYVRLTNEIAAETANHDELFRQGQTQETLISSTKINALTAQKSTLVSNADKLKTSRAEYLATADKYSNDLQEITDKQVAEERKYKVDSDALDRKILLSSRQGRYADNLSKARTFVPGFLTGRPEREASNAIKRSLKQTKSESLFKDLGKAISDGNAKEAEISDKLSEAIDAQKEEDAPPPAA